MFKVDNISRNFVSSHTEEFIKAFSSYRINDNINTVKASNETKESYKILTHIILDEVASTDNNDLKNRLSDVIEVWNKELLKNKWCDDLILYCESHQNIISAFFATQENRKEFIIIMEDSTDDSVLDYNEFGFRMLDKYEELNDFMVLDIHTAEGVEHLFDKCEAIYKRG